MPADAFVSICKCRKCEGKATPERGYRGRLSDYTWDYVNRVAKEVEKTHPDKFINCLAYGSYLDPPLKIKKLNKNIIVGIVSGRRPKDPLPEQRKVIEERRKGWTKLTPNKIFIFENYPFLGRGECRPLYAPHLIASSIKDTKDISMGEDIWFSFVKSHPLYGGGRGMHSPGFFHLYLYTTARFYWDAERDVDEMLKEYYSLFYGGAAREMQAFIEYCEKNWINMNEDKNRIRESLKLIEKAASAVKSDSVYGKRIAMVLDYLKPLRKKLNELTVGRDGVPEVQVPFVKDKSQIKIDGKFDDKFWQGMKDTGILNDVVTGKPAKFSSSFKAAVSPESIYFAIRCKDKKGYQYNIGTKSNEDAGIWYGDSVDLLIETDVNSYYQIAVNPEGVLVDLERKGKVQGYKWGSKAELAVVKGDGFFDIEIRIPYVAGNDDPLHMLTGSKPTKTKPWHFNVCRQRIEGKDMELTTFSKTGKRGFHKVLKFAKLYVGK
jgi:hypothetical protein